MLQKYTRVFRRVEKTCKLFAVYLLYTIMLHYELRFTYISQIEIDDEKKSSANISTRIPPSYSAYIIIYIYYTSGNSVYFEITAKQSSEACQNFSLFQNNEQKMKSN